jgi:hypothetical protein
MAGNMSESLRYLLMLTSLAMTLMIKIFEVPFTNVLLNAFLCEEETTEN